MHPEDLRPIAMTIMVCAPGTAVTAYLLRRCWFRLRRGKAASSSVRVSRHVSALATAVLFAVPVMGIGLAMVAAVANDVRQALGAADPSLAPALRAANGLAVLGVLTGCAAAALAWALALGLYQFANLTAAPSPTNNTPPGAHHT